MSTSHEQPPQDGNTPAESPHENREKSAEKKILNVREPNQTQRVEMAMLSGSLDAAKKELSQNLKTESCNQDGPERSRVCLELLKQKLQRNEEIVFEFLQKYTKLQGELTASSSEEQEKNEQENRELKLKIKEKTQEVSILLESFEKLTVEEADKQKLKISNLQKQKEEAVKEVSESSERLKSLQIQIQKELDYRQQRDSAFYASMHRNNVLQTQMDTYIKLVAKLREDLFKTRTEVREERRSKEDQRVAKLREDLSNTRTEQREERQTYRKKIKTYEALITNLRKHVKGLVDELKEEKQRRISLQENAPNELINENILLRQDVDTQHMRIVDLEKKVAHYEKEREEIERLIEEAEHEEAASQRVGKLQNEKYDEIIAQLQKDLADTQKKLEEQKLSEDSERLKEELLKLKDKQQKELEAKEECITFLKNKLESQGDELQMEKCRRISLQDAFEDSERARDQLRTEIVQLKEIVSQSTRVQEKETTHTNLELLQNLRKVSEEREKFMREAEGARDALLKKSAEISRLEAELTRAKNGQKVSEPEEGDSSVETRKPIMKMYLQRLDEEKMKSRTLQKDVEEKDKLIKKLQEAKDKYERELGVSQNVDMGVTELPQVCPAKPSTFMKLCEAADDSV